ncbi:prolyl oligopeptidase family serine peptidase [Pantoea ananatis]|uniref:prolyl oligopeptidase family serine peptidase n=1 Tax=Pantoea ananas TaxID=553 RepID=UPI0022205199|nr:prolyl oligopeptidase family serine peptidase [Pantoea ananatis]
MLDPSIPLTTNEYDEWGNPEQKAYYDYMLSYSPYDNVSRQAYPAMYVGQVQYWQVGGRRERHRQPSCSRRG